MNSSLPVQWRVTFHGQVQGVGFRHTSYRVCQSLAVVGWVRNRSDGIVELVMESLPQVLEKALDQICQTTYGTVDRYEIDVRAASGEFDGFQIRY